jgi:hypothetical protein
VRAAVLWQHQQETKTSSVAIRPRAPMGKSFLYGALGSPATAADQSGQGALMQLTLIGSALPLWLSWLDLYGFLCSIYQSMLSALQSQDNS